MSDLLNEIELDDLEEILLAAGWEYQDTDSTLWMEGITHILWHVEGFFFYGSRAAVLREAAIIHAGMLNDLNDLEDQRQQQLRREDDSHRARKEAINATYRLAEESLRSKAVKQLLDNQ